MNARSSRAVLTAYILTGMLTFGYSFNADYRPGNQFVTAEERNTIGALLAGMGWPLYWSVVAFRSQRSRES